MNSASSLETMTSKFDEKTGVLGRLFGRRRGNNYVNKQNSGVMAVEIRSGCEEKNVSRDEEKRVLSLRRGFLPSGK